MKKRGFLGFNMGASSDYMEDVGPSSKGEVDDMDMDMDEDLMDTTNLNELGKETLQSFCKKAASLFFDEYGLISHQINSYNAFINSGLQRVFDSFGEVAVEPGYDSSKQKDGEWKRASVRFGKVTLDRPSFWGGTSSDAEHNMFPRHARLQNMTYSARMKIHVDVQVFTQTVGRSDKFKTGIDKVVQKNVVHTENREIIIGRIPVMVKSDLCWLTTVEKGDCDFDHGGYFLIKGAEKVFIAQEQICMKRLWISNNQGWTVSYKSEVKRNRLIVRLVELSKLEYIKGEKKGLCVYFLSTEIPLWILFFALGVRSDKEVIDLIDYDSNDASIVNIFFASIHDSDEKCEHFRREDRALDYVDKLLKKTRFPPKESIEDAISAYLFPRLNSRWHKARFLGYMVKCLLEAYTGHRKCDNRDSFRNKRFELASELLERELKVHVSHALRRMTKALQRDLYGDRDVHPIEHYLDASIVTNGLTRAFSTGAWCHPFKWMERVSGVVGNLGRANPLQTMIDLRKTRQQVLYTGKVGDARYPHPSHWGRVCFLSTPDGENCGLVKNLAVTGVVSTNISESLVDKLFDSGMEELVDDTYTKLDGKHKVFLNGEWVGVCEDSCLFVGELRSMRRRRELPYQVEIKRDEQQREVRIFSDAGRILRPLLVVENLDKIKAFKGGNYIFTSLLDKGIIEFIGTEEEEDCCTAWGIKFLLADIEGKQPMKYTHCELDMSFLLGLSCGIIPFANHDHARRVLYQAQKHSQQAIGFSTTNPNIRVDTLSHQLHYPQRPLFRTMISDCLGKPGYPLGHNAVLPKPELFNGQNAIVAVNVHLGYNQEDSLVMNRASLERGMFRSEHIRSYKAEVDNKELTDKRRKSEDSITFGKIQSKIGRVDSLDDDGFPFIGANMQSGDIVIGKCAESGADHSVKLKHTERGMVQKVVLSSNDEGKNFAVVSLRQVRSPCLGDKFSSMHGQKGVLGFLESQENFPFTIQGVVPDIVINPHAFPSRQTPGQLLEAALGKGIACGGSKRYATPFSTLSRLVHMAEDKVKFRNTGPVHPLTRQPVADRKRFGGIKFGEMERDCLIAHGASANLHERLFTLSDSSEMHICQKCKNVANVIQRAVPGGRKIRGPYCRVCESVDDLIKVSVPYGAKLLCQELFSMGISLKFDTRNKDPKEDSNIGFNCDCSSFSQSLKKVISNSPVGFQGGNEMFQQDACAGTKPEADRVQLEHQAECANTSSEVLSLTPAVISVPYSASVPQKPLSMRALGLVINQKNSDCETRHPHVVESPPADGYNWRKYGRKLVKGSKNLRSYYRCVYSSCRAKKKVQHCDRSGCVVDVVYIGDHHHDPPQEKRIRVVSSAKHTIGSQVVDPSVQKLVGLDISVCSADGRHSSLNVPESEQQSSSISNGNAGARIKEKTLVQVQWDPNKMAPVGLLVLRIKERSAPCSVPVWKTMKEPEIIIHTVSDDGSSNDGYRWRKYGQKMLKGNSLVRCSSSACPAHKHVERATDDATSTTVTYEGKHDHDMPAPKKRQCSESRLISPAASTDDARCKKNRSLSSRMPSSRCSVDGEVDMMGEKISKLGGEQALESAQTLLSIGIDLKPR
ncbi:hypothetical protein NC653_039084 [Populus alba x Populus x berolinensis]|uniref:DNA-directed RNA polymerase subunit beta n=1 Tax=Populus alba x Populus x berolinensis TaxID=444605 RepID=A0AAD6LAB7_9ROSI|nr:hypothetical protein NC653_039084 [Populus alba x Populus x berolinensis]